MAALAKIAIQHGFKTAVFSSFVMVWDQNGSILVNNIADLKKWMGY